MTWLNFLLVAVLAFFLEAIDASFGMGYGTILTPAMLMLGFDAFQVVPAIIASQFATFRGGFFMSDSIAIMTTSSASAARPAPRRVRAATLYIASRCF